MNPDPDRTNLASARRVVVKIGSRLLAESPASRPAALADQVLELRRRGVAVVIVSSGAIALGIRALKLASRPHELPALQAAAAVGQSRLMQHWEHAFDVHEIVIGQVLLTHDVSTMTGHAIDRMRRASPCRASSRYRGASTPSDWPRSRGFGSHRHVQHSGRLGGSTGLPATLIVTFLCTPS